MLIATSSFRVLQRPLEFAMAEVNHRLETRLSDEAVTQRMAHKSLTVTAYQFQP
jgi:hypothetical protein